MNGAVLESGAPLLWRVRDVNPPPLYHSGNIFLTSAVFW
jgi:hypothetical protein